MKLHRCRSSQAELRQLDCPLRTLEGSVCQHHQHRPEHNKIIRIHPQVRRCSCLNRSTAPRARGVETRCSDRYPRKSQGLRPRARPTEPRRTGLRRPHQIRLTNRNDWLSPDVLGRPSPAQIRSERGFFVPGLAIYSGALGRCPGALLFIFRRLQLK